MMAAKAFMSEHNRILWWPKMNDKSNVTNKA